MTNATRVGVLIDSLHGYQAAIANGFFGFMNSQDVSVMTFALYPRGLHNLNLKAEIDYEVINPLQLDGVFVFLAQLSQFVTEQELANQMNRFRNLPMVSLARSINNTPFVKVDNRIGIITI